MFKYELDQIIYYLLDNKVHSAPVLSRVLVDNLHEDWDATLEQMGLFKRFGSARISYGTCDGEINEENAFSSKEELANSLIK